MTDIKTTESKGAESSQTVQQVGKSAAPTSVWSASAPWLIAIFGFGLGIICYFLYRNGSEELFPALSSRPASTTRNILSLIPEDDLGYTFQTLIQTPNVAKARDFIMSPSGGWLILLNDRLNFYRNGAIPSAFVVDYPKFCNKTALKQVDSVCWDPVASTEDNPVLFLGSRSGIVQYRVETQPIESEAKTEAKTEAETEAKTETEKPLADSASLLFTDGFTERSVITCLLADATRIYVADAGKGEARIYDRETGKRSSVLTPPEGRFSAPSPYMDLALDASGVVWVADPGRHRIVPFKPDGTCLESLIWGAPGQDLPRFCGCCNPSHFLILPDGRFMTAEKKMPRVKIYSESGVWETAVAGEDQLNADSKTVVQIAVAPDGWVYVLDPDKKRIVVFREK